MLLFVKANLSSFIDFLHDSFCFHSHIPFFSMSLLCSVDPQHFVLRQIQLPAHGTAAHGYLSDSVFNSHGTPLSLSRSLTLFLTFFPLPLSWLCELVLVSVLFSTPAPPPLLFFFCSFSLLLLVVSDRAWSSHTALWKKTDIINKGTHLSVCAPELSVKRLEKRALQLCDVL